MEEISDYSSALVCRVSSATQKSIMKNSPSPKNVTVVDLLFKSFIISGEKKTQAYRNFPFDELTLAQRDKSR